MAALGPARKRNRSAALAFPCRHEATFARSDTMRSSIIGLAAMAALFALPEIASATDAGAAAGATTGAVAGAVVGGPVGAVVGAGAGAVVGGATSGPNTTGTVIVEERPPATREQTCIQETRSATGPARKSFAKGDRDRNQHKSPPAGGLLLFRLALPAALVAALA